jgi:hypothetical protein
MAWPYDFLLIKVKVSIQDLAMFVKPVVDRLFDFLRKQLIA